MDMQYTTSLKKRLVFSFLFSCFWLLIQAQQQPQYPVPIYKLPQVDYTVREGLSHQYTTCLYQDTKGYLWIGTKKGLNRYDGTNFENHTNNNALPNDHISNIYEYKSILWASARYGLYSYNYGNELDTFTFQDSLETSFYGSGMGYFFEGRFYFPCKRKKDGTRNLYVFDLEKHKVYFLRSLDANSIINFGSEEQGVLQIQCSIPINNSLSKIEWIEYNVMKKSYKIVGTLLDLKTQRLDLYNQERNSFSFFSNAIKTPYKKANNFLEHNPKTIFEKHLYGVKEGKIFGYTKNLQIEETLKGEKFILSIHANDSYLGIFDINKKEWQHTGNVFYHPMSILVDRNNPIVWVAHERGISKVFYKGFLEFPTNRGNISTIWGIIEHKPTKQIYVAGYGTGIGYYDSTFTKFSSMLENLPSHISSNFYYTPQQNKEGKLFFSDGGGLYEYDAKNKKWDIGYKNKEVIIYANYDTLQEQWWLGTRHLEVLDKNFKIINRYPKESEFELGSYILNIQKDADYIWLARRDSLLRLTSDLKLDKSWSISTVSLALDAKKTMWIGSSNGLGYWDKKSDSIKFLEKRGVQSLLVYKNKYLVIGRTNGVSILDINSFYQNKDFPEFYEYNITNGFLPLDCIQNTLYQDSKGYVWVGADYLVRLDIEALVSSNANPPSLQLERLVINDKDTIYSNLSNINGGFEIRNLKYDENTIQLDFHAIDFFQPNLVQYQYSLDKGEWKTLPLKSNNLLIPNLIVGTTHSLKIRLMLRNSNDSLELIKESPKITFYIHDIPFWKKPILWGLLAIITIVGFLIYRTNKKAIIAKKEAENEKQKAKIQAQESENEKITYLQDSLANSINMHFLSNILQDCQAAIRIAPKESVSVIGRLGEMYNILFRASLNKELTHPLKDEIELVRRMLFLQKELIPQLEVYYLPSNEELIKFEDIKVPITSIYTHIENACQHGIQHLEDRTDGYVKLSIEKQTNGIMFIIEDNGVGMIKSKEINKEKEKYRPKFQKGNTGQGIEKQKILYKHTNKYNVQKIKLYHEDNQPFGVKTFLFIPNNYSYEKPN